MTVGAAVHPLFDAPRIVHGTQGDASGAAVRRVVGKSHHSSGELEFGVAVAFLEDVDGLLGRDFLGIHHHTFVMIHRAVSGERARRTGFDALIAALHAKIGHYSVLFGRVGFERRRRDDRSQAKARAVFGGDQVVVHSDFAHPRIHRREPQVERALHEHLGFGAFAQNAERGNVPPCGRGQRHVPFILEPEGQPV